MRDANASDRHRSLFEVGTLGKMPVFIVKKESQKKKGEGRRFRPTPAAVERIRVKGQGKGYER